MSKVNGGRSVKINEDAKKFANASLKRYKKKNEDYFDSKKELKSGYIMYLIDLLPDTIEFIVKYGYINQEAVQEVKTGVYQKLSTPEFIDSIKKEIKRDNDIPNIKLLPIILDEIIREAQKVNRERLAEDKNADLYDVTKLVELNELILKKKLKKFEKAGISKTLAFDLLSVIPCPKALQNSQFYRVHEFYNRLYETSKSANVPFASVMKIMIDEDYYPLFITFALLERKEKFSKYTDNQRKLYLEISQWCFDMMEKVLSTKEVVSIINTYVSGRRKDDSNGRDGNRRYNLSQLPKDDYPKITKIVTKMIADDDGIKKYM